MERDTPEEKTCRKCNVTYPSNEFYKEGRNKDGLRSYCRFCCIKEVTDYTKDNKDHVAKRRRKHYDENWQNLKEYRDSRTKEKANYDKVYRSKPEVITKELDRLNLRRAQKLNTQTEAIKRSAVFKRDAGVCYLCNEPVDPENWHLDHIIPLIKDGPHTYDNVAVTHPECNLRKGAKLLGEL